MSDLNEELKSTLEDFIKKINQNEKVQKLIKKWSTTVLVWGKDIKTGFVLEIYAGKVVAMNQANNQDEGKVKVISETATLLNMFRGKENIAHLYLEGVVETYGSEKDQIVLDAIARLLWQ